LDINGGEVSKKNLKEYAVFYSNKIMPVKGRQPNYYGLYDMHGSVMEWCQDYYDDKKHSRVLRGGSWGDHPESLRASHRRYDHPDYRLDFIGFRVAACLARTP